MVLTPSTMLPLGTQAPDFSLPSVATGESVTLDSVKGLKATLVMFISRHCPYVQHIQDGLAAFGQDYANLPVGIVAISSNDVDNYPDDAPEELKALAESLSLTFPVLYDEDQAVAKAYTAACTPDFFLFDANLSLVYRGQFDGARPGNDVEVTGQDMREALAAVLSNAPVSEQQMPSMGCNVKWKPGNEPDYFK